MIEEGNLWDNYGLIEKKNGNFIKAEINIGVRKRVADIRRVKERKRERGKKEK